MEVDHLVAGAGGRVGDVEGPVLQLEQPASAGAPIGPGFTVTKPRWTAGSPNDPGAVNPVPPGSLGTLAKAAFSAAKAASPPGHRHFGVSSCGFGRALPVSHSPTDSAPG